MKVYVVVSKTKEILDIPNDAYVIGVDRGSIFALQYGVKLDLAIGDFDSVTENEFEFIKDNTKKIMQFNKSKDQTDTLLALQKAFELSDDVYLLGGIKGRRIEHFIAIVLLFKKYPTLTIKNEDSRIFCLSKDGQVYKDDYKYISFFAMEDTVITFSGFRYDLKNHDLKPYDILGVSNETVHEAAYVKTTGQLLVIQTRDDNENNWNL